MDFGTTQDHRQAFPYTATIWAAGAAFGLAAGLIPIFWTLRQWTRNSELWKADEQPFHLVHALKRPCTGEERGWRDDADPIYWLT
jgi:hypothetical protein